MSEVKRYNVKIAYKTVNYVDYDVYCTSEDDAKDFALARFKDTHTEKCLEPEVEYTKEGMAQ
jgi:hypothetical protein